MELCLFLFRIEINVGCLELSSILAFNRAIQYALGGFKVLPGCVLLLRIVVNLSLSHFYIRLFFLLLLLLHLTKYIRPRLKNPHLAIDEHIFNKLGLFKGFGVSKSWLLVL